jgi:hypothetical protein
MRDVVGAVQKAETRGLRLGLIRRLGSKRDFGCCCYWPWRRGVLGARPKESRLNAPQF